MGIKLGNLDISYFKVGGADCSIYLGDTKLYPLQYKWIATYSGGTTSSAQCDGTSAITQGEIALSGLTDVEVFDCVSELGESAFSGCTTLRSINIPSASTSIARETFRGCENLSAITIPDGVTSIGEYAFIGCWNISSLNIPSGVTSIGRYAFMDCASVPSFTIPSGVTSINESVFWNCDSLTNIDIPDSVTSIGEYAFGHCDNLSSVTIGNGVTSIDSEAFGECISLLSVTVEATTPPTLGNDIFYDTNNELVIYVPLESIELYRATSGWSNYESRIKPINTKFYAEYSDSSTYTEQCDGSITLSTGDTRPVGYQYSAMTRAEIGCEVENIGDSAFRDCSGLTSVTIPDSVTSIGTYAFEGCRSLTSIDIPSGVTSIGLRAFAECSGLTSITVNATTPPTLGNDALTNTNSNLVIYVPAESVNAYKTAWPEYAERITAIT